MWYHFYDFLASWHDVILTLVLSLLGQLLREARLRRGWTIEHASEQLGVDWATLSRWERNKQWPHERNLLVIEQQYPEISVDWRTYPTHADHVPLHRSYKLECLMRKMRDSN